MFIVMHCMGLPFDGDTIKEKSLGGSETAAYYMAKELSALGHKVTMFTNKRQKDTTSDGVKYIWAGMPTENAPLGESFHFYAEQTPHDVCIIQRHPAAFRFNIQAKVKLWWLHDLAIIRHRDEVRSHLWNIDGILTVSQFHKDQICEVYGINSEIVYPIQNGIDLSMFGGGIVKQLQESSDRVTFTESAYTRVNLLYSSRPERGLEHHVCPNGIMERLYKIDPKYHLYVCNYDNTTAEMKPYYDYLYQRCEQLPNVTVLGHLTKQELYDVMRQCDAMVYPTPGPQQPNFEEVSCITAMECMAAGLPFISSNKGALPETCKDSGSILLDLKDGLPDLDKIVEEICYLHPKELTDIEKVSVKSFSELKSKEDFNRVYALKVHSQLETAKKYSWDIAAKMLDSIISQCIGKSRSNGAMLRSMIRNSDIYAAQKYASEYLILDDVYKDVIAIESSIELNELYGFAWNNTWSEHYEKYYQYEKERGINYGPEKLDGNSRFEHVSSLVATLPEGSSVLDYGCAHGHYTINLAKRFPALSFTGVDITESNIEKARQWAKDEGLENINFYYGKVEEDGIIHSTAPKDNRAALELINVDLCIAAEVVEHVGEPQHLIDSLCTYLKPEGQMVITTPFGPWEAIGYDEHWPWRAHVHHFDRQDLHDMYGHMPDFKVAAAPNGTSKWGTVLGSYITTFNYPEPIQMLDSKISMAGQPINYQRKFKEYVPQQTISLCMIVKDAEATIKKCLDSVLGVVDEIVVALDETTTDRTKQVIEQWDKDNRSQWPIVTIEDIKSPKDIGFDEARNLSIKGASGDWVLWLDADEILVGGNGIFKYLHNNAFDGYALKQHHFTVEPLGVMKTDLPCRLFRNHLGIKFFGVVHEHPEKELNEGVGHVQLIPDIEIAHQGYTTENIRRGRFERNIELLVRDREKYPERILGKYLWMRDLAQMCKYELEYNGGRVTPEMKERAHQGIEIWEWLLDNNHTRMVVDGMEFYSTLNQILDQGFEFTFALDSSKMNGGVHLEQQKPIHAQFASRGHVEKMFNILTEEKVKDYGSKYF